LQFAYHDCDGLSNTQLCGEDTAHKAAAEEEEEEEESLSIPYV
jgi:hypothetical protein